VGRADQAVSRSRLIGFIKDICSQTQVAQLFFILLIKCMLKYLGGCHARQIDVRLAA
jgi:hypothetical protein